MKRDDQRFNNLADGETNLGTVKDLFDEMDPLEESPKSMAQSDVGEDSFKVAVGLEDLPDSALVSELESRGYIITDLDTLDRLHDSYWTDPNADAHVREWIRRATGRL